jgi:hypothetical protein
MKSPRVTESRTKLWKQQQENNMRENSRSGASLNHGLSYGPDTSGFNADNASDFIRERAYQLFEIRGRAPGHELEDWLEAEQEIKTRFWI